MSVGRAANAPQSYRRLYRLGTNSDPSSGTRTCPPRTRPARMRSPPSRPPAPAGTVAGRNGVTALPPRPAEVVWLVAQAQPERPARRRRQVRGRPEPRLLLPDDDEWFAAHVHPLPAVAEHPHADAPQPPA